MVQTFGLGGTSIFDVPAVKVETWRLILIVEEQLRQHDGHTNPSSQEDALEALATNPPPQ